MSKVLKLLVIPLVLILGYLFFVKKDNAGLNTFSLKNISLNPSATPFEFQEMTIPSLRNRNYKSQLGPLNKYSENSQFTTYLTSYDSDGLKVNGLLTIPKNGNQKHPAIVFVHGYVAPTIYTTTERYNDYVNYLSRNGYVVFKIDLRGHGTSEGEAGGSYYSADYIVDTLNAYAALEGADFVDSKKIGLWGHSMAGNVTFRSLVVKKNIPAVAIWAGAGFTYKDLAEYRISDMSYRPLQQNTERARRRQRLRELYGEFSEESTFWKQVTPVNYLDEVTTALSLYHAVDDNVVSIEYSRNLNKILAGTKIIHELYEYSGSGHNISGSYFTSAMADTVAFFDKYLKNRQNE